MLRRFDVRNPSALRVWGFVRKLSLYQVSDLVSYQVGSAYSYVQIIKPREVSYAWYCEEKGGVRVCSKPYDPKLNLEQSEYPGLG